MKDLSEKTAATVWAVQKGYKINKMGDLYNPKNTKVIGFIKRGYRHTGVRYNNKNIPIAFHRMQAYQKFGISAFKKQVQVRHLNGNPLDNSWDNIAIGTQYDNTMDIPPLERKIGASNPVYNHEEILEDRNSGMTYKQIMEKHGISSKGTVSFIINKSLKKQGIK